MSTKCVLCKITVSNRPSDVDGNQKWLNRISESILSILSLGQEVYFPIFSTATYCRNCLQLIRDADWTYRTVCSLSEKLEGFKQEIADLFWADNVIVRETICRTKTPIKKFGINNATPSTSGTIGTGSRHRKIPTKYAVYQLSPPPTKKSRNQPFDDTVVEFEDLTFGDDNHFGDSSFSPPPAAAQEVEIGSDDDEYASGSDYESKSNIRGSARSRGRPTRTRSNRQRTNTPRSRPIRGFRDVKCAFDGCNFSTTKNVYLENHVKSTHDKEPHPNLAEPYKCDFEGCDSKFSTFKQLKAHRGGEHDEAKQITNSDSTRPYRCDHADCNYTAVKKEHLKAHIRRIHTGSRLPFVCDQDQCGRAFSKGQYLREHMLQAHDPNYVRPTLKCTVPECSSIFLSKRSLDAHVAGTHWDWGKLKCDICWKLYEVTDERGYEDHLNLHKNAEEPFSCVIDSCTSLHTCTFDLRNHYLANHNPMGVTCKLCEQVCINEAHYKSHMKNHQRKSRTQAENEPCSFPGCTYIPRSNYDRKTHGATHSNVKEYACEECGNAFKWKSGLSTHMKVHQANHKRFKCVYPGCDKEFSIGQKLRLHEERAHSNLRPYVCHGCGKGYKSKNDLSSHLRQFHGDLDDPEFVARRDRINRKKRENRLKLKEKKISLGQVTTTSRKAGPACSKRSNKSSKSQQAGAIGKYEKVEVEEVIIGDINNELEVREAEDGDEIYFSDSESN